MENRRHTVVSAYCEFVSGRRSAQDVRAPRKKAALRPNVGGKLSASIDLSLPKFEMLFSAATTEVSFLRS